MRGVRPIRVVAVVIRIGRQRDTAAFSSASDSESPSARKRFTPCSSTSVALIATPPAATRPNTDGVEKPVMMPGTIITRWPSTAPAKQNGSAAMMMSGWKYERSGTASSAKIANNAARKSGPARAATARPNATTPAVMVSAHRRKALCVMRRKGPLTKACKPFSKRICRSAKARVMRRKRPARCAASTSPLRRPPMPRRCACPAPARMPQGPAPPAARCRTRRAA